MLIGATGATGKKLLPLLLADSSFSRRAGKVWALKVIKGLNKLGLLRKQSPLSTPQLTQALLKAFQTASKGETVGYFCFVGKINRLVIRQTNAVMPILKKITLQNKSSSAASSA